MSSEQISDVTGRTLTVTGTTAGSEEDARVGRGTEPLITANNRITSRTAGKKCKRFMGVSPFDLCQ
jgi:S-adenosylmethionine synthetase